MAPQMCSRRATQPVAATRGDVAAAALAAELNDELCDADLGDICDEHIVVHVNLKPKPSQKAASWASSMAGLPHPPMPHHGKLADSQDKIAITPRLAASHDQIVVTPRQTQPIEESLNEPLKVEIQRLRRLSQGSRPDDLSRESSAPSSGRSCPPRAASSEYFSPQYNQKHKQESFPTRSQPAAGARTTEPSCAERFARELCPGDVLSMIDDGFAITRLGAAGGYMGHVLLVASHPRPVQKRSAVGKAFQEFRENGDNALFMVGIVECSRSEEGLTENDLVLSVDKAGRVKMCGEVSYDGEDMFHHEQSKEVHIWQSPSCFRGSSLRLDVMCMVLQDMRSNQQNWSWSTAVRAFLFSGEISSHSASSMTMKDIEDSWKTEPICTSVVVIFWQRYLQKLASLESTDPLHLILQFMPLLADRVLPGELHSTMLTKGWSMLAPSVPTSNSRNRAGTM